MNAPTPTDIPIPDWLRDHTAQLEHSIENNLPPPDPRFPTTKAQRELRTHHLECLFERVLEAITEGGIAQDAIENDSNGFKVGEVMTWIRGTPERLKRYREAQKIRAEIYMESSVRIADGDGMEDVQRSKLRIDTRAKAASVDDRERYGQDATPSNPYSGGVTIVIGEVAPKVLPSHNIIEHSDE